MIRIVPKTKGGTSGIHRTPHRLLAAVRRAANTRAPFAGVPFAPGERPFIFEASVLRTVAACPKLERAEIVREIVQSFGQKTQRIYLVLWGNGAEFKLLAQDITRTVHPDSRYQMQSRWAEGQRTRRATARLSPEARRNKKYAEEIAKLGRKLQKLHLYKPEHPLLYKGRPSSDYERESVADYFTRQREGRRALAKIAGKYLHDADWRPAKRWQSRLLTDLTSAGFTLHYPYAKVKNGTRGRTRYHSSEALWPDEYCKKLWKWVCLSERPYAIRDEYERFTTRLENYRGSRATYISTMRDRRFIEGQLETIRDLMGG
jgi:hypothetical protein